MSVWGEIRNKSLDIEPRLENTEIIMPMARRVFSKTIAQNLVDVQPMAPPTGGLFYFFDPKTAKKVTETAKKVTKAMIKKYGRNNQNTWGVHQLS